MVNQCVVYGCASRPDNCDKISFFRFPKKDEKLKKTWVKFVNKTRIWPGPTSASRVCSLHFEEADFENLAQFNLGFCKRLKLKSEVYPSILPKKSLSELSAHPSEASISKSAQSQNTKSCRRSAFRKRLVNENDSTPMVYIKKEAEQEDVADIIPSVAQALKIKLEYVAEDLENCKVPFKSDYTVEELQLLDGPSLVKLFAEKEALATDEIKFKCRLTQNCTRCYIAKEEKECKALIAAHMLNHAESILTKSHRNPSLYTRKVFVPCLKTEIKDEPINITESMTETSVQLEEHSDIPVTYSSNGSSFESDLPLIVKVHKPDTSPCHESSGEEINVVSCDADQEKQYTKQPKVILRDVFKYTKDSEISALPLKPASKKNKLPQESIAKTLPNNTRPTTKRKTEDNTSSSSSDSDSSDTDEEQRTTFSIKSRSMFGNRSLASALRSRTALHRRMNRAKFAKREVDKSAIPKAQNESTDKNASSARNIEAKSPLVDVENSTLSLPNKLFSDTTTPQDGIILAKKSASVIISQTLSATNSSVTTSSSSSMLSTVSKISVDDVNITEATHTDVNESLKSVPVLPPVGSINFTDESSKDQKNSKERSSKDRDGNFLSFSSRINPKVNFEKEALEPPLNIVYSIKNGNVSSVSRTPSILRRKSFPQQRLKHLKNMNWSAVFTNKLKETQKEKFNSFLPAVTNSNKSTENKPFLWQKFSDKEVAFFDEQPHSSTTGSNWKQDLSKSVKDPSLQLTKDHTLFHLLHDHNYATPKVVLNATEYVPIVPGFVKLVGNTSQPSQFHSGKFPNGTSVSGTHSNISLHLNHTATEQNTSSTGTEFMLKGPSSKQIEVATDPKIKSKALRLISELRHRKPKEVMVCTERRAKDGQSAFIVQDFYTCEICGKRFTAPNSLYGHYRGHAGIKPYRCKICGQSFTRSHSLTYHQMIHSNTARFECKHCNRKFRHPTHYKEHMYRHTGEEPYICTDCPRRFRTRNTIRRHMITKHHKKIMPMGSLPVNSRIINFINKPLAKRKRLFVTDK